MCTPGPVWDIPASVKYDNARIRLLRVETIFSDCIDSQRVLVLGEPISNDDATNREYVDSKTFKDSVRVSTIANQDFNTGFAAGQAIDGVVLDLGDRILIKDQADATENGIYIVTNGAPTRSNDAQTIMQASGIAVVVQEGGTNADTLWECSTSPAVNFGAAINFIPLTGGGTGSPGGPSTSVQFNNSGTFGGSLDLTWDGSALNLADNRSLTLGTAGDLSLLHNGTSSSIVNSVGDLDISIASTAGDNISLTAGTGSSGSGTGGSVVLTGGTGGTTNGDGGDIVIGGGVSSGSGSDGTVIFQRLRAGVSSNVAGFVVSGSNFELVESVSQRKYKKDEVPLSEEPGYKAEMVLDLEPKFFTWKEDEKRDMGFIVEDTVKVHERFVHYDKESGEAININDRAIIAGLVEMVKKLEKRVSELEK